VLCDRGKNFRGKPRVAGQVGVGKHDGSHGNRRKKWGSGGWCPSDGKRSEPRRGKVKGTGGVGRWNEAKIGEGRLFRAGLGRKKNHK